MLESLFKGAGTIHELNMEGAFPAPKLYRPRRRWPLWRKVRRYRAELRRAEDGVARYGRIHVCKSPPCFGLIRKGRVWWGPMMLSADRVS